MSGFLDFISKLKNNVINIPSQPLAGFATQNPIVDNTNSGLVDEFLPVKKERSKTEPSGWFKDGAAHIYPQNLFSPGNQAFIYFAMRDSNLQSTELYKRVGLYMPPAIQVKYGTDWEEVKLKVEADLAAVKDLYNAVAGDERSKDAARQNMSYMFAKGGANVIDSILGGDDFGNEAQVTFRKTIDPHQALLFKSVQFREFQLDFQLLARTEVESEEIRRIIKIFKWGMHPAKNGGAFYTYPNVFDVYLCSPVEYFMFNISQCVLTNMSVDYGGSGAASFFKKTGAPVDVRLSLTFKELSVLTKEMIEQDY